MLFLILLTCLFESVWITLGEIRCQMQLWLSFISSTWRCSYVWLELKRNRRASHKAWWIDWSWYVFLLKQTRIWLLHYTCMIWSNSLHRVKPHKNLREWNSSKFETVTRQYMQDFVNHFIIFPSHLCIARPLLVVLCFSSHNTFTFN